MHKSAWGVNICIAFLSKKMQVIIFEYVKLQLCSSLSEVQF